MGMDYMKRAFLLKMQRTTDLKLFLYQNTLTLPKNFGLLLIFFSKKSKKAGEIQGICFDSFETFINTIFSYNSVTKHFSKYCKIG